MKRNFLVFTCLFWFLIINSATIGAASPSLEWTMHKSVDDLHPSAEEQQMLWFINRARQDPVQEGNWLATLEDEDVRNACQYFHVDLDILKEEFETYEAKPPAAFDIRLYNAAVAHSNDLIARDAQDHEGQFDRVDDAGFHYMRLRGNVFSYGKSIIHSHAAFNIDWGYDDGDGTGMQPDRGHRQAIMSLDGDYTNVGIAVVPESNSSTDVGPLVITQNFAEAYTAYEDHYNRFIVGTVWSDNNKNSLYDPGEGVGGVNVFPDHGKYFAVTSANGGYAVPILEEGDYQIRFSGNNIDTTRTIHVGSQSVLLDLVFNMAGIFFDVSENHWAFSFIKTLYNSGISSGCGNGNFCPDQFVTRAQMAVFLLRAKHGSDYNPPDPVGIFDDVDTNYWAAAWVEELYDEAITSGCSNGNFCPDQFVTRAQMAIFLLKAKHGSDYTPPDPVGIFDDVDTNYWAAAWIEELYNEGITSGCGTGKFCPNIPVTRGQMAVFLVRAFDF